MHPLSLILGEMISLSTSEPWLLASVESSESSPLSTRAGAPWWVGGWGGGVGCGGERVGRLGSMSFVMVEHYTGLAQCLTQSGF